MKTHVSRAQLGKWSALFLLLSFIFAALPIPPAVRCEPLSAGASINDEAISEARAASMMKFLDGEWVGGRLLCRKEEDNSVRCGKPASFSVTFREDGTGSSADEHFPNSFTYGWKSKSELVLTSNTGGKDLTLFQFEIQEGFLTFQAYIYLAVQDPDLPKEANYIHYIFDVHRIE